LRDLPHAASTLRHRATPVASRGRFEILVKDSSHQAVDLTDVVHRLLINNDLAGYESPTRFYEVGTPAGIADMEAFLEAN
jgi:hypothetical protein